MNIINDLLTKFVNSRGGINSAKIKMKCNAYYLDGLINMTNFLPKNIPLRYRFNYIKEGIYSPKLCKECNKLLVDVYKNFCSSKCSNKNIDMINKMKNTWHSKSDKEILEIQTKRRNTNKQKYGVDIASKLPEVIEKNKQSHIKSWGDYAMRNKEVVNKRNKNFIDKWGGIGMASPDLFSKMKNTNIQKYGVEYYSQSEDWYKKCIETATERYGKEWVSKVDYINAKQQAGGYSYYDFEFPSGKVIRVQGYEPKVLTELLTKYNENDIIVGVQNIIDCIGFFHYTYEGATHRYYPDIYIKSINEVIEVKSQYTFNREKEKNLLKRQSVLEKGINFKFIIL